MRVVSRDRPATNCLEQRPERFGDEIGGKLRLQFLGIGERKFLGIGLDEEVERIDDREFGGQIDLDAELVGLLRKDEARQPIAVRVLLPVHEMLGRRHLQRIARHLRAAMRRGPQPDGLRPERDRTIVTIARDVLQSDENRQGGPL